MEESSDSDGDSLSGIIDEIRAKIVSNPYHYDSYVHLIKLLRQAGDLDGARKARNDMANVFPLSESLWLQWIKDELPLASLPDALLDLRLLFERAIDDYLTVSIWMEYCQFAVDKMSEFTEGIEFPRQIYERAITAVGLHTSKGSLVWNSYREFEMAVFQSLQEMQVHETTDSELKSQVETQFDKIDKLFRRQLAVPLIDIEDTFQNYQSFSDKVITEESLPAYTTAKKRLEHLIKYEEQLVSSSPGSKDTYTKYLDELKRLKEESTLIDLVYQRAISDHPLDSGLWKDYITFLSGNFVGVVPLLLKGHKQAIRNCPWIVDFWIAYVHIQEKVGVSHEEIIATFEKSVGDNFSQSKEYLQAWMAYCDYLRRKAYSLGEGEVNDLRRLFRRAREYLDTYFGREGDPRDILSQYQASLEARCYGNMEEARILWDDVMSRHGREADYWLKYASLERTYGDLALCRKLLQRAVNSASDDSEKVCDELLQFEREQGTLETFESAVKRCASQLQRVQERKEKAFEKEQFRKEDKKQQRKERRKGTKSDGGSTGKHGNQSFVSPESGNLSGKRKRQQIGQVFFDEGREDEKKEDDIILTVKKRRTDSGDNGMTKESVSETQPQGTVSLQPSISESTSQPPVVMDTEENVMETDESEKFNPLQWLATEEKTKKAKKKPDKGKEDNTVFVSNLTFSTTEQQLRDVFNHCGEISDIRLIKTRKGGDGRGNVYSYIEFSDTEPIKQALLMDRNMLNNKPMFVSPFKDGTKETELKYTNNKATVYISNIPHDVTQQQLEEIFTQAGVIKEVRLVTNRQGRSKGFAYIEYITESSANTAVIKLDNHFISGKKLNVAISNPPSKSTGGKLQGGPQGSWKPREPIPISSFGIGGRKSKSNITLVPRAVVRSVGSEHDTGSKKSNEDFRQMLLKKQ